MKLFPFLFFLSLSGIMSAQFQEANKLYNAGVAKYNEQKYAEAEKLFTSAAELGEDRDTYFSRGLCREKLGNKNGFCEDMASAASYGHAGALSLFLKNCGRIDSSEIDAGAEYPHINSLKIIYYNGDVICKTVIYPNWSQDTLKGYQKLVKGDRIDSSCRAVQPSPRNGVQDAYKFIGSSIRYPAEERDKGISGKVYVQFMVYEDGTLHNITALRNTTGFPAFAEEARRVIALLPPWKPACNNGKPIKFPYTLPIAFTVR